MDLEKVKKYFKKHGEFIFRTNLFHFDNIPDDFDAAKFTVYFIFQNAFLGMLKNSATEEQVGKFQSELVPEQMAERLDKGRRLCEVAEQYFDALLHENIFESVPDAIKEHVLDCHECSEKFFKYSLGASTPLNEEQQFYIKNMIEQLGDHFSLLKTNVCCRDVKRFLPVLLDQRLQIRIPTPITVHIDNCPQCYKNLSSLSKLNLRPKQLARLSRFYREPGFESSPQCGDVRGLIDLIIAFRYDKIPIRLLDHICLCRSCRKLVWDERRAAIDTIKCSEETSGDQQCELVTPPDLFDLAFPFGIDCSDPESHIFRKPFIRHIAECPLCLRRLGEMSQLLYFVGEHTDSGIATFYEVEEQKPNFDLSYGRDIFDESGFADFANWFHGEKLSCGQVKRFLPMLADIDRRIQVPIEAIAHVEQCSQCKEDLNTIRSWKLSAKKYMRLAEFFAEESFESSAECGLIWSGELSDKFIREMNFEGLNADTLKHLCLCRSCRGMLYSKRLELRTQVSKGQKSKKLSCNAVESADLFDYVFPYGIDPADDQYAKCRASLTRHFSECPVCLEKARQMHNSIYAIADRGRLEPVTGYEPEEEVFAVDHRVGQPRIAEMFELFYDEDFEELPPHLAMALKEPYNGWGIKVQVFEPVIKEQPKTPAKIIRFPQKIAAVNLKTIGKAAVAAMIPIAICLFFFLGTSVAKAVDLREVYEAIAKISNVCISSFVPGKSEPIRKEWVSHDLTIRLQKTQEQAVLFDLGNGIRKIKDLRTDSTETTLITDEFLVKVERYITGSFGLLPFSDISSVPEDARWNRVDDTNIETVIPGAEVYDLIWAKVIDSTITEYHKWRVFIDVQSKLPTRTEWYIKISPETEYKLENAKVITYPTNSEIKAIIQVVFD